MSRVIAILILFLAFTVGFMGVSFWFIIGLPLISCILALESERSILVDVLGIPKFLALYYTATMGISYGLYRLGAYISERSPRTSLAACSEGMNSVIHIGTAIMPSILKVSPKRSFLAHAQTTSIEAAKNPVQDLSGS